MPFSILGFGFAVVIWVVALVALAVFVWRGRTKFVSGTYIVLRGVKITDDPAAETVIEIWGRIAGIMSWILTTLGLEPEYHLSVTRNYMSIRSASLGGTLQTFIPLDAIRTSVCGYQRSVLAFGFAVWFALGTALNLIAGFLAGDRDRSSSDMGIAFGELVLAAIAALVYHLSKRIAISAEATRAHGIVFKSSLAGGLNSVDLPEAVRIIELLNRLVLEASLARRAVAFGAAEPANPSSAGFTCPSCHAANPSHLRFCENCGTALG